MISHIKRNRAAADFPGHGLLSEFKRGTLVVAAACFLQWDRNVTEDLIWKPDQPENYRNRGLIPALCPPGAAGIHIHIQGHSVRLKGGKFPAEKRKDFFTHWNSLPQDLIAKASFRKG